MPSKVKALRASILQEQLISLNKARRLIPTTPSFPAVQRWAVKGCSDGRRLESCLIGSRRMTSVEAVERFLMAGVVADEN